MKKLIKSIANFFIKIWKFIDKKIIIPITKLILSITGRFDKSGKQIENWLSKTSNLLFISMILAIAIFIAVDQKLLLFSESSAEVLKNQPITVTYNQEAYVVEGLPETVDVTLIGRRADLLLAKRTTAAKIEVDLTGLKPGQHKVNIKYNKALESIDYKVNPSVATVIIYPKISMVKTLNIDLLNQESLSSKHVIKSVDIDNDKVVVKGAEHTLKKVASVKALVNIKDLVNNDVGITTLRDVPLRAYDEDGNIMDVELVPNKINAQIEITSPSKELPIKVIPKGQPAFGWAISSIDINETKVTVYGDEDKLNELKYIPVEIDVTDLKANRQYKQELVAPLGVKSMSVNNVTVNVSVEASVDRVIDNVNIEYRNLSEDYKAQGFSESDVRVSVVLKGVASVINQIKAEDITAYLDLAGYKEGEYEVDVNVTGTDVKVEYIAKTKKVKIKIYKK